MLIGPTVMSPSNMLINDNTHLSFSLQILSLVSIFEAFSGTRCFERVAMPFGLQVGLLVGSLVGLQFGLPVGLPFGLDERSSFNSSFNLKLSKRMIRSAIRSDTTLEFNVGGAHSNYWIPK